jgi:low temperature requirement protein LtrA
MTERSWWQKPQIRTDEEQQIHRKVTWLELFFDLVFVVVISELAHYLAKHISFEGTLGFILLFVPVWWVWMGATYYNERFETDGLENRLFTFLQILPAAGLAVFAHDGFGKTSVGFALSYALARGIITYLWWRAGVHEPKFRPTAKRFVFGFSIAILLFISSIFIPPPSRFILWAIGLVVDIATPFLTLKQQLKLPRLSTSKLPERYGLFVIIVLGESVVAVVKGLAAKEHLDLTTALTGILGMAFAFGIWWVYFDFIARRPPKARASWSFAWGYLHMPLVVAIASVGAGILNLIEHEEHFLPDNVRLLIGLSVGLALATIGLLEITLHRHDDEPTHPHISPSLKLGAAGVALIVAVFGGKLDSILLLSILIMLVGIQMIYGFYVSFVSPHKT